MDALVAKCLKCATPLLTPRRLRDFCSYACRGQLRSGVPCQTGKIGHKNPKQAKTLRTPKTQGMGVFTFCKINACTIRIDRAGKKNGVGWLMEVAWSGGSRQRWVVRVGDQRSEPLPLEEAKRAATALLHKRGKGEAQDWIGALNKHAAAEVDRVGREADRKREFKLWPTDLLGGSSEQRKPCKPVSKEDREDILADEIPVGRGAAQGDDYPLEFHEDGYPKLPECLRRNLKLVVNNPPADTRKEQAA
jgi:hypothetical protein